MSVLFLIFALFPWEEKNTVAPDGVPANQWKHVAICCDGNALFAMDRDTGKPLWSETGLFYRESFDFDDREMPIAQPPAMTGPFFIAHDRLYVVLKKTLLPPQKSKRAGETVLAAFHLKQEGKLIWRLDRPVVSIDALVGDQLTATLSDQSRIQIDIATGEIVSNQAK